MKRKGKLKFRPRSDKDKIVTVSVTLTKSLEYVKGNLEMQGHEFVDFESDTDEC